MVQLRVGVKLRDGPGLVPYVPIGNPFGVLNLFNRPAPRQMAPIPSTQPMAITTGEDIGIRTPLPAQLPVGAGRRDNRTVGGLETFIPGPSIRRVVVRPDPVQPSSPTPPEAPATVVDDIEPLYPEGSIFAPGEVWGPENREPDFETPPIEVGPEPEIPSPTFDDRPVLIPVDAAEEVPGDPVVRDEPVDEEEPMSTFADIASGVIDVIQGQPVGGRTNFAAPLPPGVATPGTDLYYSQRNRLCGKRRRRRRLLTESDFNDLMRIATLPNKQNVTVALAKAVGRR